MFGSGCPLQCAQDSSISTSGMVSELVSEKGPSGGQGEVLANLAGTGLQRKRKVRMDMGIGSCLCPSILMKCD